MSRTKQWRVDSCDDRGNLVHILTLIENEGFEVFQVNSEAVREGYEFTIISFKVTTPMDVQGFLGKANLEELTGSGGVL